MNDNTELLEIDDDLFLNDRESIIVGAEDIENIDTPEISLNNSPNRSHTSSIESPYSNSTISPVIVEIPLEKEFDLSSNSNGSEIKLPQNAISCPTIPRHLVNNGKTSDKGSPSIKKNNIIQIPQQRKNKTLTVLSPNNRQSLNTYFSNNSYMIVNLIVFAIFLLNSICMIIWELDILPFPNSIPLYIPGMFLLLEIGIQLILAFKQSTYSLRFRIAILLLGLVTLLEAGIIFNYANPLS